MSGGLMELPEGWIWTQVSEVAELISGQHILSEDYSNEPVGVPYLTGPADFSIKYPIISKWTTKPKVIAQKDDVLITVKGNGVGKTNILAIEEAAISRQLMAIRALESESNFFFLFLQANFDSLQRLGTGSTVPGIDRESILSIEVPLPPLNEQKRIVTQIEALRERSQKAKAALEAIPELCDRFRQSVLAAAFRGDLTADWREENPDVEPASVLLERIRGDRTSSSTKQKVNLEAIDLSNLTEVPESWGWEKLVNISHLLGGVTKGRKFNGQATIQVPYLRVANVQDGFLDLNEIKEIEVLPGDINKYYLENGDILFTEGGDRDKLGRGTVWHNEIEGCIHQNHVYRARLCSSAILPEYISLAAKTEYAKDYFFRNASQTVNLASINITTLGRLPVPIPPSDEQKEICNRVYKLFQIAESLKCNYQNLSNQLDRLNQSILAKAFRGELVEQDPNDEPASVLLERIRAEREAQQPAKKQRRSKRKSTDSEQINLPLE